jgi:hypothetical protein
MHMVKSAPSICSKKRVLPPFLLKKGFFEIQKYPYKSREYVYMGRISVQSFGDKIVLFWAI